MVFNVIKTNSQDLINNFPCYYEKSLEVLDSFGGPSIYFHIECIKEQQNNFLSDRHIELIYATLASWGMHRMGGTKAKLNNFKEFKNSILTYKTELNSLKHIKFDNINNEEYRKLLSTCIKCIYFGLEVSVSDSSIVSNSKTLAHILPNLIPPIDRQYTIRFFRQCSTKFIDKKCKYTSVTISSAKEDQYALFVEICLEIKRIFDAVKPNCHLQISPNSFNTSYPKIMDNVIMAYVRHKKTRCIEKSYEHCRRN